MFPPSTRRTAPKSSPIDYSVVVEQVYHSEPMAKTDAAANKKRSEENPTTGVIRPPMKGTGPVRGGARTKRESTPYQRRQSTRRRTVSIERISLAKMDEANESQEQQQQPVLREAEKAEETSLAVVLAQMQAHFDTLNGNQKLTNNSLSALTRTVSDMTDTVNVHTEQINRINKDVKLLQNRPLLNVEKQVQAAVSAQAKTSSEDLDRRIQELMEKKMDSLSKDLDKVKAVQAVQVQSNIRRPDQRSTRPGSSSATRREDFDAKHLDCRGRKPFFLR